MALIKGRGRTRITLPFATAAGFSPADGETWYWGATPFAAGGEGFFPVRLSKCKIKGVVYTVYTAFGSAGSTENASVYVRKNATSDTLVSSVVQHDQAVESFSNQNLDIDFAEGDSFEFKIVYPTFATNPTNIVYAAAVTLELPPIGG